MQEHIDLPERRRGTDTFKTDSAGTRKNTDGNSPRPAGGRRPYLLTTFRPRKTKESKAVTSDEWKTLRKSLTDFAILLEDPRKERILNSIRKWTNANFLEEASEALSYYEHVDCSVILDGGVKKLCFTEEICFYDDDFETIVRTDRIDRLKNEELKSLIYAVLSYLYKKTCITEVDGNAMRSLMEEYMSRQDEFLSGLDTGTFDEQRIRKMEKSINAFSRESRKYISRIDHNIADGATEQMLDRFIPKPEEKEILSCLKDIMEFTSVNARYLNDDDDYNQCASIALCFGDFIMLSNCDVPTYDLTSIFDNLYEGDMSYPFQRKIMTIDPDGSTNDRQYLSEFSRKLCNLNVLVDRLIKKQTTKQKPSCQRTQQTSGN